MHFFKRASTILLLFPLLAFAKGPIAICLTGRIAINLPSYGESFVNAANLAVEQSDMKKTVIIKKYFYDDRPLSPISAYQKMVDDKCSAIIGFEYLSDLLLVVRIQNRDTNIPIFTSYASTLGENNLPKNIFIFMPSYRFLADKMINFSTNKFGHLDRVLLITEINRDSMKQYRQAYIEKFKKENIQYETFEILENDKNIIPKIKKFLKRQKKFKYVFVLSGVIASSKIINELNDSKMVFFGTENYGSSTAQSLYIRLTNKNINSYFIRNFDSIKRSRYLEKFENAYEEAFHSKPLSLSAYTYDATRIILNAISQYNDVSADNISKINYLGASGIKIQDGEFYRSPEYIILKVTPKGYQYAENLTN